MKPLNFPNMLLFSAAASSLLGRNKDAFMSSGLVGIDLPAPLDKFVLPDMGDDAFDEEPSLMIGFGLKDKVLRFYYLWGRHF